MKVNENGIIRDMTEEEIKAFEESTPEFFLTAEERLEAMEEALLELAEVMLDG